MESGAGVDAGGAGESSEVIAKTRAQWRGKLGNRLRRERQKIIKLYVLMGQKNWGFVKKETTGPKWSHLC